MRPLSVTSLGNESCSKLIKELMVCSNIFRVCESDEIKLKCTSFCSF